MTQTKQKPANEITTGKCRFSYANVWEARQIVNKKTGKPDGKPHFSVTLLFPKKDKASIRQIEEAIEAAKVMAIADKKQWNGTKPKNVEICLRDGDEKFETDESKYAVYENMMYITAKANEGYPPKVLKIVDGRLEAITERNEFYSGAYGKASLRFYGSEYMGKYFISANLNNLLKLEDGPNLGGGGSDPEVDFAEDLDDL